MNSDSPETDAGIQPRGSPFACVPIDFARRLERERNETMLRLANQDDEMIAVQKERDALRAALRELLIYAEDCALKIENEWGMGAENIHELEERDDLPDEIRRARVLLGEAT